MTNPLDMVEEFKDVANLRGLHRGLPCVGQITRWDNMRNLTPTEMNLGPGYYAYCDLKRCE